MISWTLYPVLLAFFGQQTLAGVDDWHYIWPSTTSQCEEVTVTISGGVPPWHLDIIPIGGQPLYWQLTPPPQPVNSSYPATVTIPLQLAAGTPYVTIISDSEGFNEALTNPSPIQVVQQSSDSSCFAAANPAKKTFDFQVYGDVAACDRSFGVSWTTGVGKPPFWCTIVPLDSSFNPWNVQLTEANSLDDSAVWRVNMTSGTRFTVVMHDGYGEGRGGVGQIYEVATSSNSSCVTQRYNGRSDWPAGLKVMDVPTTTTAWASLPSQTTGSDSNTVRVQTASTSPSASVTPASTKSALGTGAIAGIAAGGAVIAIVLAAFLFWYLRRKRSRSSGAVGGEVDLFGGGGQGPEPKVEPFRSHSNYGNTPFPVPVTAYGPPHSESNSTNQTALLDDHFARSEVTTPYTPGSAVPLLGAMTPGNERPTSTYSKGGYNLGPPGSTQLASSGQEPFSGYFPAPSISGSSSADTKVASPTAHPLPQLPLGAMGTGSSASPPRSSSPEFRRHTDGGEVEPRGQGREVVDLPPLYDDVPSRSQRQ